MKKNNGFTLIELLAVILILGIIALIAIPTVTGIITDAKVGAKKETANSIVNAYEQYMQLEELSGRTPNAALASAATTDNGSTIKSTLGLKGSVPTKIVNLLINNDGDALIYFVDGTITCSNYEGATTTAPELTVAQGTMTCSNS